MSIGLNDKESWESSGTVGSLKVERRPSFWLCGIACDESSAIDNVSASDGKVDPVDCEDKKEKTAARRSILIPRLFRERHPKATPQGRCH